LDRRTGLSNRWVLLRWLQVPPEPGKNDAVTRILALVLGLAVAGGAFFVLSMGDRSPMREVARPLDDIDDASRAALERVLEAADR
jgi:hypothetical protein